jgi:NitT/TauT family transport system ATP-binding protein
MEPSPAPSPGADHPVKLRLTNVSKTYASGSQSLHALQPVTTEVREGEFVIFFGPSGCGKSTLLNIIAGLEAVTTGEITLDGRPVEGPHHDRLMMFQFLQMVHLDQFERASIHELSGGMKQRVALARALAPDPKVLLVDEPFPALDALTRAKLLGDLQDIFLQTKKTIILVTHDPREAACLGDRVLVFSGRPGRVKADITIDLTRPRDINDPVVAECATGIMEQLGALAE